MDLFAISGMFLGTGLIALGFALAKNFALHL